VWNNFLASSRDKLFSLPWKCAPFQNTPNCAVIVEPRKHPDMEYAMRNVSHFLGEKWSVCWFHGIGNAEWAREIQTRLPCLHLIQLPVHDLQSPAYDNVLKSPTFWPR
jgi:hypothetical protein